jgi:cation:H+ antiporter
MLLPLTAIILGFAVVIWSADRFIAGAAGLARSLGVSPMVIGLTIVGFGTSAPEMLISGFSAWEGSPGLAIGNAIGSNITNIALILGVTAMVSPLAVHSQTLRREMPLLTLITLVVLALLFDGNLSLWDGLFLMTGLFVVMGWIIHTALRARPSDPMQAEYESEVPVMPIGKSVFWLILGLLLLLVSSRVAVWGAVEIAQALGVSDLIIGLTIVAIGTSLPELAATVVSALKDEADIAIGNVIGSNMFNILGVLALPGLIAPGAFDPAVLTRDYPVMFGLTIALFVMAYGFRGPGRINRIEGGILLACFIGYQGLLAMSVTPG